MDYRPRTRPLPNDKSPASIFIRTQFSVKRDFEILAARMDMEHGELFEELLRFYEYIPTKKQG